MSQQKQEILKDSYTQEEMIKLQQEDIEKSFRIQEAKTWANIKDQYMLQPIYGGDGRVLVKVDGHKSKYDCTACSGKGCTDKKCGRCSGTKRFFDGVSDIPCPSCTVGEGDGRKTYGFALCEQCKGKGGTIIIPDTSQRNTYSGVPFKFLEIDFKIMVEKDILGIMRQLAKVTDGMQQGTYADLDNVGVA